MTGPARITGTVHHFNLSVSDLARSTQWYTKVFGLRVLRQAPDPDGRWDRVIMTHPSGLLVGLTAHRTNTGEPASELHCGVDHLALQVENAEALGAWVRYLDELEVEHSEIKESPLGKLVALRDPDNVQFELYAPKRS
jgi:catechol 2,3-dioxygenase-like lactoylglutathione lyase family enzyme